MPTFNYKAKKGTGETVTGHIEAQNQDEAIDVLNRLELLPITVTEHQYASAGRTGMRPVSKKQASMSLNS